MPDRGKLSTVDIVCSTVAYALLGKNHARVVHEIQLMHRYTSILLSWSSHLTLAPLALIQGWVKYRRCGVACSRYGGFRQDTIFKQHFVPSTPRRVFIILQQIVCVCSLQPLLIKSYRFSRWKSISPISRGHQFPKTKGIPTIRSMVSTCISTVYAKLQDILRHVFYARQMCTDMCVQPNK